MEIEMKNDYFLNSLENNTSYKMDFEVDGCPALLGINVEKNDELGEFVFIIFNSITGTIIDIKTVPDEKIQETLSHSRRVTNIVNMIPSSLIDSILVYERNITKADFSVIKKTGLISGTNFNNKFFIYKDFEDINILKHAPNIYNNMPKFLIKEIENEGMVFHNFKNIELFCNAYNLYMDYKYC